MARSGIQYEDVREAAESLLSRGLSPTIQRVREVLGTGSNTTISEHLKRWQQRLAEAPRAILPPAIPEAVMSALDAFWKTAVQQAETAFEEQRVKAAQAVAAAEQARDQALTESQQARIEAAEVRHQWEALQISARELADRLLVEQERRTVAESAIAAAEERVEAAMAAVTQIRAETEARVAQLDVALHQARIDMDQQKQDAQQRFEAERQRGEASESRLMQQLDRLRQEHIAERQTFATERQEWKTRAQADQEQREVLRRENVELRTALAAAQGRQETLDHDLTQLRIQLQQSEARHLDAVRETELARGELKAALAERERLQQELANRPAALPDQPLRV